MSELAHDDLLRELARLRALVGPCESSYTDLQQDVLAARDAARGAEASAGVLRGQIAVLEVELARARQDQEHFQRAILDQTRSLFQRLRRSVGARVF